LPQEWHNHSNNSVAYLKSDTIDYFAQQAASTNLQLGRLPQERYDRQTSPNKQHDQSQLGYIFQEQHDQLLRPKSSQNNYTIWQEWPTNSPQKQQETTLQGWLSTQESSMIKSHAQKGGKNNSTNRISTCSRLLLSEERQNQSHKVEGLLRNYTNAVKER